jgi:predicted outer membrane protein
MGFPKQPARWALLLLALAPLSDAGAKEPKRPSPLSVEMTGRDLQFLREARSLGEEIDGLSRRITSASESPALRVLAAEMGERSKEIDGELARLAAQKGVPPPAQPHGAPQPDPFEGLGKGPKLEKAIMEALMAASRERVVLFESSQETADRDLRRIAVRYAPTLREQHRRLARIAGVSEQ